MKTYEQALKDGRNILVKNNILDSETDAWYLLSHVLDIDRTGYFMNLNREIEKNQYDRYMELVNQRTAHIPLQYLTGVQEFMGLEFIVSKDVLIPRQDTETMVEEVLKVSEGKAILDMCTGSGCIIISLMKLGRPIRAVGVDISPEALDIAKKNKDKHKVEVEFIESNLFDKIEGRFDIIVSNPPYIPTKDIEELMEEVKDHEPLAALDGSEDGLSFYRIIASKAKEHLNSKGILIFEIGYDQGEYVANLLKEEGFVEVKIIKDLGKLDRVVCGIMK